jgi:hypothetical protein
MSVWGVVMGEGNGRCSPPASSKFSLSQTTRHIECDMLRTVVSFSPIRHPVATLGRSAGASIVPTASVTPVASVTPSAPVGSSLNSARWKIWVSTTCGRVSRLTRTHIDSRHIHIEVRHFRQLQPFSSRQAKVP